MSQTKIDALEDFVEAAHQLAHACTALGINPPSCITFKTGVACNLVSDGLLDLPDQEGIDTDAQGHVTVYGITLKVQW